MLGGAAILSAQAAGTRRPRPDGYVASPGGVTPIATALTDPGPRLPSMDASRPARALSRPALGSRLPPSIRSRRPKAAGPDEFRGPAPDHNHGLLRPRQVAGSA